MTDPELERIFRRIADRPPKRPEPVIRPVKVKAVPPPGFVRNNPKTFICDCPKPQPSKCRGCRNRYQRDYWKARGGKPRHKGRRP